MKDVNIIIKSKEIEGRINKEGINKVIEDFMKNLYKVIEGYMIFPDKEKSKFNKKNKYMIIHSQMCIWDNYKELVIITNQSKASCRIYIYNDEPDIAYISNLYVDEKERNKGIGGELLKYCIDKAKQLGCNKIQLRSDNEDFVRVWYFKLGFKVIKSEVWFEKDINDRINKVLNIKNQKDNKD